MAALTAETIADLTRSGLTRKTIDASGIEDEASDPEVGSLLRDKFHVKGYKLNYGGLDGSPLRFYRVKVLASLNGHTPPKYLQPKSAGNHLYLPIGLSKLEPKWADDPSVALVITEGEKKALAAVQAGVATIAVGGVYNWRTHIHTLERGVVRVEDKPSARVIHLDDRGERAYRTEVASELDAIEWAGREVFVIFDSDATTNDEVQRASFELANWLGERGANTKQISLADRIPRRALDRAGYGPGAKLGLDDVLCLDPSFGDNLRDASWRQSEGFRPLPSDPLVWVTEQLSTGRTPRPTQERVASFAINWLDANGTRFMGNDGTYYFFDSETRVLHDFHPGTNLASLRETSFGHLLVEQLGLDPTDASTLGRLIGKYPLGAPLISPHRVLAQTPDQPDTVYYQLTDADVIRVSAEGLALTSNGDDDVLFYKGVVSPLDVDAVAAACNDWKRPAKPLWFSALDTLNIDPMGDMNRTESLQLLTCLAYLSPWLNRWRGMMLPLEIAVAEPNSGKAQPLDAKILTPSGWSRMGRMMVGSKVIGVDGKAHNVVGVWPQGKQEVFQLTFSDGSTAESTGDHLWEVDEVIGQNKINEGLVLPLNEILKRGITKMNGKYPRWRFRIPTHAPVEFARQPVQSLDPYALGLLLGDGGLTTAAISFTTADPELVKQLEVRLPGKAQVKLKASSALGYDYGISYGGPKILGWHVKSPLRALLEEFDLFGKKSHDKFVPVRYLRGSISDRLAVLRGLMDTDGGVDSTATFTSTSQQLANDVVDLARSLGATATVWTFANHWRVQIRSEFCPFQLKRKAEAWKKTQKPLGRTLRGAIPNGVKEVQCITTDAPRGLYLTDDYVVTHNSFLYNLRKGILTGYPSLSGLPNDYRDWVANLGAAPAMWVCDNLGNVRSDYWHRLNDELARLITDPTPSVEMRKLYTTADTFRIPINATFAITTIRNPFNAPDVLQRALVYQLNAIPIGKRDPDWYTDRLAHRVDWLAEHLNVLHLFLKRVQTKWQPNFQSGFRLVHFEQAVLMMGAVLGWDLRRVVDLLPGVVAATVAQYDPVIEAFATFVEEWDRARKKIRLREVIDWAELDTGERFINLRQFANEITLGKHVLAHKYDIEQSTGITIQKEAGGLLLILPGG